MEEDKIGQNQVYDLITGKQADWQNVLSTHTAILRYRRTSLRQSSTRTVRPVRPLGYRPAPKRKHTPRISRRRPKKHTAPKTIQLLRYHLQRQQNLRRNPLLRPRPRFSANDNTLKSRHNQSHRPAGKRLFDFAEQKSCLSGYRRDGRRPTPAPGKSSH